jgi:hypothetical protein
MIENTEEEAKEKYRAGRWSHFFTGTVTDDATRGALYLATFAFAERLAPEDFIIWICARGDEPVHVHGVLATPQSPRAVTRHWRGGFAKTKPFRPDLRDNLLSYIEGHTFHFPVIKE